MSDLVKWGDTRPCGCGKKMILVSTGITLTSYPAQHPTLWKCYGCGAAEKGPIFQEQTTEQAQRQRWEENQ